VSLVTKTALGSACVSSSIGMVRITLHLPHPGVDTTTIRPKWGNAASARAGGRTDECCHAEIRGSAISWHRTLPCGAMHGGARRPCKRCPVTHPEQPTRLPLHVLLDLADIHCRAKSAAIDALAHDQPKPAPLVVCGVEEAAALGQVRVDLSVVFQKPVRARGEEEKTTMVMLDSHTPDNVAGHHRAITTTGMTTHTHVQRDALLNPRQAHCLRQGALELARSDSQSGRWSP
jgi:hypothetical protein